ncbi:Longin domain-containing protein [Artemisia annua]|uniref:Longin domain-containing protein n=1 Tax=Artemisia annua TaxID=35608 RepID=A0A2U1NB44_ARTAN|nr:Longin domain-containing protein [Artemisia annua]
MVKLTIVGRVNDGLPMSQGPIYDEDDDNKVYKQHAEFLLHETPLRLCQLLIPPSSSTIIASRTQTRRKIPFGGNHRNIFNFDFPLKYCMLKYVVHAMSCYRSTHMIHSISKTIA